MRKEPFLMPFQGLPFNGDTFMCDKFLELKEKHNVKNAVELGCCVGGTTKWLSENFDKVYAIEINEDYLNFAKQRALKSNITFILGNTVEELPAIMKKLKANTIFHIDSHWSANNPLLAELEIIANSGLKPVIEVHDMKVPGHPELGFDTYKNIVYEWDWIKSGVEKIYGADYLLEYNSSAVGAKRGAVYISPK